MSSSWCQAPRDHDHRFFSFLQRNPCGHSPFVTSPLTIGWVCLLPTGFASPLSSVLIEHVTCYWKFFLVHYIQALSQFRVCKAFHVCLAHLMLQRQLSHLDGRKLTAFELKCLIFPICDFVLSYAANTFILVISYD
jgi:hypothetical protein